MIVRWGSGELPRILGELGIERPFVVASERWDDLELPAAARWREIPSHRIEVPEGVDGVVAVGGGSAIDTAKAASAASGLPLVSIPTTYSGAEWTTFFGARDPSKRMVGGGGGARAEGIVYDVELTLGLPREETAGTALNASRTARRLSMPPGATKPPIERRSPAPPSSPTRCRACSSTVPIAKRGHGFWKARCTRGPHWPGRASLSVMRWRRRSGVDMASRTAR